MDKYRRIPKSKEDREEMPEGEIRVTARGRTSTYVSYAFKLLNEKELKTFTVRATGTALGTAVTVVEIVKRRYKGLHQVTTLGSMEIVDEYEPLEEGLEKVVDRRQVAFVEMKLSTVAGPSDLKDKGYQPPLDESLVKEFSQEEMVRGAGGRRKGKGKGKGKGRKGKGKGKGKGRGKGRNWKSKDDE